MFPKTLGGYTWERVKPPNSFLERNVSACDYLRLSLSSLCLTSWLSLFFNVSFLRSSKDSSISGTHLPATTTRDVTMTDRVDYLTNTTNINSQMKPQLTRYAF